MHNHYISFNVSYINRIPYLNLFLCVCVFTYNAYIYILDIQICIYYIYIPIRYIYIYIYHTILPLPSLPLFSVLIKIVSYTES